MKSREVHVQYDVVIVGGGPAGLAAALLLGRSRKQVLLADGGSRRNAAARHIQGFVTRDGTPPDEFRRIAREQLAPYGSVDVRDAVVRAINPAAHGWTVDAGDTVAHTRRVLLCTGMEDVLPSLPGLAELWGTSVFQCPYCHGWEVRGLTFAYLASRPSLVDWAPLLKGWSDDVMVLTDGRFEVTAAQRERLEAAGIALEERPIAALRPREATDAASPDLAFVLLADGTRIARRVVFYHPPQRQTALVSSLGLAMGEDGFVQVDAQGQTSAAGMLAAGDLTSSRQSAILAAADGFRVAAALNHQLTFEGLP